MIKRINKIKNLGVFSNYTRNSELKNFDEKNIIYGWNFWAWIYSSSKWHYDDVQGKYNTCCSKRWHCKCNFGTDCHQFFLRHSIYKTAIRHYFKTVRINIESWTHQIRIIIMHKSIDNGFPGIKINMHRRSEDISSIIRL